MKADDAFRCTLRQWEMGVAKPVGIVSSRRLLLDIRVDALYFVDAIKSALMSEACDGPNTTVSQFEPDESWHRHLGICPCHRGRKNTLME